MKTTIGAIRRLIAEAVPASRERVVVDELTAQDLNEVERIVDSIGETLALARAAIRKNDHEMISYHMSNISMNARRASEIFE